MTITSAHRALAVKLIATTIALDLTSVARVHGSARQGAAGPHHAQPSDARTASPERGTCERESAKVVGQKAVQVGRSLRAPKKRRHVSPNYPQLPPGTQVRASGAWVGEILINTSGAVARVWALREFRLAPPFPAFNDAIVDAIAPWTFEPTIVSDKATPVCMAVTINIDWQ